MLQQGRTYLVREIDTGPGKVALARPTNVPYTTKFRDALSITMLQRGESASDGWIHAGPARVTAEPLGFKKVSRQTMQVRTSAVASRMTLIQHGGCAFLAGSRILRLCRPSHESNNHARSMV